MTSLLSQKAVLSSLNIGVWQARKYDRKVSEETNKAHGAKEDAGRYNKSLIAREHLNEIAVPAYLASVVHRDKTQPWLNDGIRILPTANYLEVAAELRKLKVQFDEAADKFIPKYPDMIAEAKRNLNGMFNEADYPSPQRIREKFHFDVKIFPVPDAKDFRIDIAQEHLKDLQRDVELRIKEALDAAMKDSFNRIIEVVGHMAERLNSYKPSTKKGERAQGTFRDTLVDNVRDLAKLLPAFNLTGDKTLAKLTKQIETELCRNDAETLREAPDVRKAVAESATQILQQVSAYMA
jgi:hypothetical protein